MTDTTNKIVFPPFGTLASSQSSPTEVEKPLSAPPSLFHRDKLFYGAASNLMEAFFRAGFAPGIDVSSFKIDGKIKEDGFNFYVLSQPDDKYPPNTLHECARSFIREVSAVVSNQELETVTAYWAANPTDPSFFLKIKSSTDLMDLLNNLLKPYEITLGLCFNAQAIFMPSDGKEAFALSPLYSIEHVRALYLHTQGVNCQDLGLGLQLSH